MTGMVTAELDLSYHKRFPDAYVPQAYEKLILDCLQGQHANFVRNDELRESWKLFDKVVQQMREQKPMPLIYKRGTRGPAAADERLVALGVKRTHAYSGPAWKKMRNSISLVNLAVRSTSGAVDAGAITEMGPPVPH